MPYALLALTGHPTGDDLHGIEIGIEIVKADTTPAGCCWSANARFWRGGFTIAERRRKAFKMQGQDAEKH